MLLVDMIGTLVTVVTIDSRLAVAATVAFARVFDDEEVVVSVRGLLLLLPLVLPTCSNRPRRPE